MSWFWAIRARTLEAPFVADTADLKGVSEWDLLSGRMVSSWSPLASYRGTEPEVDGTPDDVLQECLDLPVFSSRLRSAIERAELRGVLEYLPVSVFRPSGRRIDGFSIANLTLVPNALDHARSDFRIYGEDRPDRRGEIRDLRAPVLIEGALEGLDIVRLAEYPLPIYVSDRFVEAFDDGGFTGFAFERVAASAPA